MCKIAELGCYMRQRINLSGCALVASVKFLVCLAQFSQQIGEVQKASADTIVKPTIQLH